MSISCPKAINSFAKLNFQDPELSNGMYKTPLTFTLAGANATGYDPGTVVTVGPGSIPATAIKEKADGVLVMRVDDQAPTIAMTGTIGGTPTPFVEPWKITDAGQTKVLGE